MTTLTHFTGDLDTRTKLWTDLDEGTLRRRAVRACRDRDLETLWGVVEAYLVLQRTPSAHTLRAYRRGVEVAVQALEGETITAPHRHWGQRFVRALEGSVNANRLGGAIKIGTVRARVAAAKALFAALRWAGATSADPFKDVRLPRDPEAAEDKRPPYNLKDVDKLLLKAKPRDRVLVFLGAHAGLRVAEICALMGGDVNLGDRTLKVRKGKGNKKRTVSLSAKTCEAIQELGCAKGQALVQLSAQGTRAAMRRLCAKAGVTYLGVHSLRHASGTRLYAETKDLKVVAKHLGHANVETSAIYAKLSDDAVKQTVTDW
jgi:integrase/recombinase XerC